MNLRISPFLFLSAGLLFSPGTPSQAQTTPTLSVDAAAGQHPINPNIYGIVNYGLDPTFAQEIKVPNIRWGGDGTTRYNWQVDSSNSGFDWYFMGGNGSSNPVPGASADQMINTFKPAGAGALITIPIIPYINSTSAWTCSFPTSVYGAQQSTNPYVHPNGQNCGNSLTTSGTQLTDTNILANHIPNSVTLQQGWIQHLVGTFGTAANGGVPFYQLDNEPGGWSNTHRDVEPTQPAYSTVVSLGQQYAAMIKQVDPSAMVLGPSDFTLGGWIGSPSQQSNLYAGQYYLQQMAAYNGQTGKRVLDYFDEHYYPQFSSPATQLASTRTLWDPTYNGGTWVEQYFFNGPMQLIPRFHQWIGQYYPGTKLAISEYSIDSGNKLITDALAEADVLGIFGQQGVDFANMWIPPAPTDPIAYAFRLFRNYDSQGSQFGGTGISAMSTNPGNLSVYAAQRASDNALTVVVLNKTTAAIQTSLSIADYTPAPSATVYSYSNANLKQITAAGIAPYHVQLPQLQLPRILRNYLHHRGSANYAAAARERHLQNRKFCQLARARRPRSLQKGRHTNHPMARQQRSQSALGFCVFRRRLHHPERLQRSVPHRPEHNRRDPRPTSTAATRNRKHRPALVRQRHSRQVRPAQQSLWPRHRRSKLGHWLGRRHDRRNAHVRHQRKLDHPVSPPPRQFEGSSHPRSLLPLP